MFLILKCIKYYLEVKKIGKLEKINAKNSTNYKIEDINENLARGTVEVSSITGSMIGLSALSPMVSRPFVRPVLKMFGINADKPKTDNKKGN